MRRGGVFGAGIFPFSSERLRRYVPELIVAGALVVRLGFVPFAHTFPSGSSDFWFYSSAASFFNRHGTFDSVVYLAPGWSAMLAYTEHFFTMTPRVLAALQAVLGAGIVAGTYLLGKRVFGARVGSLAALTAALWPMLLLAQTGPGDTMLLYTLLLVFGLLFYLDAEQGEHTGALFFAAAAFAAAALTDVIGLYVPLVLVTWMVGSSTGDRSRALARSGAFLAIFVVLLTPWAYRNYLERPTSAVSAPFIEKRIEKDIVGSKVRAEIRDTLTHHPGYALIALEKFLVPFNLSLLDTYTPVRYADVARNLISGRSVHITSRQLGILFMKMAITLLHLIVLGCAIAGLVFPRTRRIAFLWLGLVAYVFVAALAVGVLTPGFTGISLLNGFLFPLMPLALVIAVASVTEMVTRRA